MFNTRKCYLASQTSYHCLLTLGVRGTVSREMLAGTFTLAISYQGKGQQAIRERPLSIS